MSFVQIMEAWDAGDDDDFEKERMKKDREIGAKAIYQVAIVYELFWIVIHFTTLFLSMTLVDVWLLFLLFLLLFLLFFLLLFQTPTK